MANVLPPEALDSVWAMYRSRLILVTGTALLVLAGVGLLTLVPSYVALRVAAPPVVDAKASSGQPEDAAVLERAHLLMGDLAETIAQSTSSIAVIEEVLSMRPSGIQVTRVTYQSGASGQVSLSGRGSRQAISGYRDALLKSGQFASVSVPVGSLVSAEGGDFTIVVIGDF